MIRLESSLQLNPIDCFNYDFYYDFFWFRMIFRFRIIFRFSCGWQHSVDYLPLLYGSCKHDVIRVEWVK